MLRTLLALPLLLALFVVPGTAGATHEEQGAAPVCAPDHLEGGNKETCKIWPGQDIADAYRYGQAIWINCGKTGYLATFPCPRARDVNLKITVIKSVKKTLGLNSTTISNGKALGPMAWRADDSSYKETFYFAGVRDGVERKMKAKKVRAMGVTVSGTITGVDGSVKRFSQTRSDWSYDGNCGGMGLKIQRHLTYGGTCYRH